MNIILKYISIIIIPLLYISCSKDKSKPDAYGNFESDETIIASEISGRISDFELEEGDILGKDQVVGFIDSTQLVFMLEKIKAGKKAIASKMPSVITQVNVLKEQKVLAEKNLVRIENMLQAGASTQSKYDEIRNKIEVIDKQILSIESQNASIFSEMHTLDVEIERLADMIRKCSIKNPIAGTVTGKFGMNHEIIAQGRPLYKIADLDNMVLKAYVSGEQLPDIELGQNVNVSISDGKSYTGKITWVSSEYEFTPNIIQTKEERVNQVYAIKIKVKNDGNIKIGMPGEVFFDKSGNETNE